MELWDFRVEQIWGNNYNFNQPFLGSAWSALLLRSPRHNKLDCPFFSAFKTSTWDRKLYFTGEQGNHTATEDSDMNIINLTEHVLNQDQISVLSKGLGFLPCNKGNPFEIYKDICLFLRRVNFKLMFFGKTKEPTSGIQMLEMEESQLVDFLEENTWIDSDILDPPPPSGLANKSQRFPNFSNNKYLQMFLEAITEDIRSIKWDKIEPMVDNLSQSERKTLQELKELSNCIIKPSDKSGNVVLWPENEYLEEINRQLNDDKCYENGRTTPFPTLSIKTTIALLKH